VIRNVKRIKPNILHCRRDNFVYSATIGAYYRGGCIDRDAHSRGKREIVTKLHTTTRRIRVVNPRQAGMHFQIMRTQWLLFLSD